MDYCEEFFLSANGFRYVYPDGSWYKIEIAKTAVTETHPGGVSYCLAYFDAQSICRIRFDNAHPVRAGMRRRSRPFDHWHRFANGELVPYSFVDLPPLFEDFFQVLEAYLNPELRSSG